METRLQLIEGNFESQQSGKSDLLIHIGHGHISYAIVDKGREQLKALADYTAGLSDLETMMQSDRYLKYYYRKIKIMVNTFRFTFIPGDIYSASEIDNYAKFISPGSPADVIVNDIRAFRIKNVMAVDTALQQAISSHVKQPVFYSQANPFIEGARKATRNIEPGLYGLCINLQPESMEIAIIQDENLLFYNLFESHTPDEFNYFLLMLIKQFELDTENTEVIAAGQIEQNDICYLRLKKYFNHIKFADPCTFVQCSDTFAQVNLHHYFSLLSLNLCE